ncbi:MarR family transcriptional regulator [Rhodococcus opacus]|uniref:MarR family transcriptional regulator n=1 Tax=Rhodococcus opacus TaxID=37919 RepID=UPI001C44084B|nr:MarR family transcriptional regulator [Rhodococcus opacus]MBV6760308.1 MarR family transcriptional regulator [Rhodococcus opacus]
MSDGQESGAVRVESLSVILTRAARALAADLDAVLKPHGLATDHWLVLESLTRESGLTMTALVDRTGTNGATLTRVVDRLVSNALAYREVDAVDRRKVRVYASTRGRALHRKLAAVVEERERALVDAGLISPQAMSLL